MKNVSVVSPEARTQQADQLAKTVSWKQLNIHTNPFSLKAYGSRVPNKSQVLTVYIEGDGLAWISNDIPSDNPTPLVATGLKMAIHDQKNYPIVYLARPCQYLSHEEGAACQQAYWTNLRFSSEVIQSMNQAVDYLKKRYHAEQIKLIGYSGGGTIAALISARRKDVVELITIAAVLDVKQWTQQEKLTPLVGSLNPADVWQKLISIQQTHWVGAKDTVVPKENAFSFAERFPEKNRPKIKIVTNFDHTCCWVND